MRGITKRFPGVLALDSVDFSLKRGEVHALVGENGAGKSTLMNILGGSLQPDEGTIEIDGRTITIATPIESLDYGIGFVHQESNLLGNLTVLENIFLSRENTKYGFLNRTQMRQMILCLNERLGYCLNPDAKVDTLSLAEQQCVEIARALVIEPKVLILDEPTAALDEQEVEKLFETIRHLRQEGVAIIYISHRLDEIFQLTDHITVLKDGKNIGDCNADKISKNDLVAMMVGRVIEDIYPARVNLSHGEALLDVTNLTIPGKIDHISFCVRKGEIVGIGGLEGQGQRDAIRAIFGAIPYTDGKIVLNGKEIKGGIYNRIQMGIGYVTHDRRGDGLVLDCSVRENIALSSLYLRNYLGFVRLKEEKHRAKQKIDHMNIKVASIEQKVAHLSGGNQQKVMLARWLMINPHLLIIDEPTKGIDVGARISLYKILDKLTRDGVGILMLTSDMMELIGLSDRVLVFCEGKITKELEKGEITEERIMRAASNLLA